MPSAEQDSPSPHRQLLDADPLPQPLRRLGSSQTAGYDTHPLHLHPGKLPPGKVLPEEIRDSQNTIKERYEKIFDIFKIKKEERVSALVALIIACALNALTVIKYHSQFSQITDNYHKLFVKTFHVAGF